jgi:spore coat protein X
MSSKKEKKYKEKDENKYSKKESRQKDHFENESSAFESFTDAEVVQDADQFTGVEQDSDELIFIKDSCNITVNSTNNQASVSLQVGLQLAIALVIKITIGDTDRSDSVAQDLLQYFDAEQSNKQKIIVKNSKDIEITTTDTDLAVNIQALLQVLVALVAKLDIG